MVIVSVWSQLTDNIEVDSLAAGGVIPPRHLTLVLPSVGHRHTPDHQHELRPVLPHHRLDPSVPGVAQVVEGHQLRYWSGVAQPGHLRGKHDIRHQSSRAAPAAWSQC